jgi:hypothetical protein
MLFNNLYFRLKPLIPRPVRLGVRRWFARRKRKKVKHLWPIAPGSGAPPKGWPGWPAGKEFAFVLTHDVECQRGLDCVTELAELEMEMGFRSSFNFVPEGVYSVPAQLREWLVSHGFEVGVHDLNHDGRLFSSLETFRRKAQRINSYLEKWNAVGFRSGYMLRNLEWLQQLHISYDASTFDTDPFEPQPDGFNTIFPFWVPRNALPTRCSQLPTPSSLLQPANSGYLELPYTLPQDSTLFLMLQEKTIEIWQRKLDWIAGNGGMALVNIHPDYVQFGDAGTSTQTYPVQLFIELLRNVRQNYSHLAWNPLPREVAAWTVQHNALESRPVLGSSFDRGYVRFNS